MEMPSLAYPNPPSSGSEVRWTCTSINPGRHVPGMAMVREPGLTGIPAAEPMATNLSFSISTAALEMYVPWRTLSSLSQRRIVAVGAAVWAIANDAKRTIQRLAFQTKGGIRYMASDIWIEESHNLTGFRNRNNTKLKSIG